MELGLFLDRRECTKFMSPGGILFFPTGFRGVCIFFGLDLGGCIFFGLDLGGLYFFPDWI